MNPEIENLINIALADGIVTDKEREIILRKADALGVDKDEVEMILEGRIAQLKSNVQIKETVVKCPSCGAIIQGLSQVCSSCGYVLNKSSIQSNSGSNLHEAIDKLENFIIEVKSYPKPSFISRLKTLFLTYFSFGFYLIYRKFTAKKGDSFDNLVAKCEKEKRQINTYYGEDKKVRQLLVELDAEINNIQKERKSSAQKANLGCFGLIIVFVGIYAVMGIWSFKETKKIFNRDDLKRIDSLIQIGKIDIAKQEALKITNEYRRNDAQDKILIYEIDQLIKTKNLELAKNKAISIKSEYKKNEVMDNIINLEIEQLIESKSFEDAEKKTNSISSEYKRNNLLDKILKIEVNTYIEENKLEKAKKKANLINNEYERKNVLDKVNKSN